MKCSVSIGPISVYGYTGAYSEEKKLGREFIVNIEYTYNCKKAVENDDLFASVDYSKVVEIVKDVIGNSKDDLTETTAFKLKNEILLQFNEIENLTVEIDKKNPPIAGVASFKVKL